MRARPKLTVLAGGVGAAKFLRGLIRCVDPAKVTIVVNTADDDRFFGLAVSPDLDTITYTLAGVSHRRQGWGLEGDRFRCLAALGRFYEDAGWFRLGDADLATHMYRTDRLAQGAPLSTITTEIARAFGVKSKILPMTDQTVRTIVFTDRGQMSLQDYLVRHRARPRVQRVSYKGTTAAGPAPGVLAAVRDAECVVIAPSNPFLSIGPILAMDGVKDTLKARHAPVVAISPIVGGRAVSGPLAQLLQRFSYPCTPLGISRLYDPFLTSMVIDRRDWRQAEDLSSYAIQPIVADTVLTTPARAERMARVMLHALDVR